MLVVLEIAIEGLPLPLDKPIRLPFHVADGVFLGHLYSPGIQGLIRLVFSTEIQCCLSRDSIAPVLEIFSSVDDHADGYSDYLHDTALEMLVLLD